MYILARELRVSHFQNMEHKGPDLWARWHYDFIQNLHLLPKQSTSVNCTHKQYK